MRKQKFAPASPIRQDGPCLQANGGDFGPQLGPTQKDSTGARAALKTRRSEVGTWQRVADGLPGFSKGYLNQVERGKRSPSAALLVALGLKSKTAEVTTCPDCGQVHVVGWCTQLHGEPEMPKPRRPRTSSPYIRAWPTARLRWAFDNREVMA